jgi:hypothetical protein
MLRAISLGFASLSERRILSILLTVMVLTLLLLIVLGIGLWFGIDQAVEALGLSDSNLLSAVATFAVMAIAGLVLFRSIAVAITWVFRRYYRYHRGAPLPVRSGAGEAADQYPIAAHGAALCGAGAGL